MKKHGAKKIYPGLYEYRGYEIENAIDNTGYAVWNIKDPDGYVGDADNTLTEAKRSVDSWIDQQGQQK